MRGGSQEENRERRDESVVERERESEGEREREREKAVSRHNHLKRRLYLGTV